MEKEGSFSGFIKLLVCGEVGECGIEEDGVIYGA